MIVLNIDGAQGRIPAGWQVKVNRGTPDISLGARAGRHLSCGCAASAHPTDSSARVDLDPADLPYLHWRWKVTALTPGRRLPPQPHRRPGRPGAGRVLRPPCAYLLWDTTAPKGTMQSRQFPAPGAHLRRGLPIRRGGGQPVGDGSRAT